MPFRQVAPTFPPVPEGPLSFEDVLRRYEAAMDWMAQLYVNTLNAIHYAHDKYNYERLQVMRMGREREGEGEMKKEGGTTYPCDQAARDSWGWMSWRWWREVNLPLHPSRKTKGIGRKWSSDMCVPRLPHSLSHSPPVSPPSLPLPAFPRWPSTTRTCSACWRLEWRASRWLLTRCRPSNTRPSPQ